MTAFHTHLSKLILDDPQFQVDARSLFLYYYSENLASPAARAYTQSVRVTATQIRRLCQSASVFACSEDETHQRIAYDLATQMFESQGQTFPSLASVARLIMARTGNIPSIDLLPDPTSDPLPPSLIFETLHRQEENTTLIGDAPITLTDFQRQVWEVLRSERSASVSGPTSAGKTFIITAHITAAFLSRESVTVALIVPTRALIRQVQSDLERAFIRYGVTGVQSWTSVANPPERLSSRNLFVMTQERLQFLLTHWPVRPQLDILVVDEAQKIEDGARGVLLEDTILELANVSPRPQVVFLTPMAQDPERLLALLDERPSEALQGDLAPVSQYVYSVRAWPRRLRVERLTEATTPAPLLDYAPPVEIPTRRDERMAVIALELGGGRQSLIYANDASEAERIALAIGRRRDIGPSSIDVQATVAALREYVHEEFSLNECLLSGAAYHYRAMPDIARLSVEDLFRSSEVSFIACTSTLLEGINMPARNVFVCRPRQGRGHPMSDSGFWNLAGRAGRLMRDFSGNVYCIDESKWDKPVNERERRYKLASAFEVSVMSEELSVYIEDPTVAPATDSETSTHVVNTLVSSAVNGDQDSLVTHIQRRAPSADPQQTIHVASKVIDIAKSLRIPAEFARLNRGIDIRLQQSAFDRLSSMSDAEIIELIPISPFIGDFSNRLSRIYKFIFDELRVGRVNSASYFSVLSSQWIREDTLRAMIDNHLAFRRRRQRDKQLNINTEIRGLITAIEDTVRFTYVKGTKCFIDLLQLLFQQRTNIRIDGTDLGLPYYLELGMCREGTIALHNLGVSRTTSIVASRLARQFGIREEDIPVWLRNHAGLVQSHLPRPCSREISQFLSREN
jgi:hypothetical protein